MRTTVVKLLMLTGAVAAVLLGLFFAGQGTYQQQSAPAAVPAAPVSSSPSPSIGDSPSAIESLSPSGAAADAFAVAWLERDPARRRAQLEQVTMPDLLSVLMLTDPTRIPQAAPGPAVVVESAEYHSACLVPLTNGWRLRLVLLATPGSPYGWLVESVERD